LRSYPAARLKRRITVGVALALLLIVVLSIWNARRQGSVRVEFSYFEDVVGGKVAVFRLRNVGIRRVTVYCWPGTNWPEWLVGSYDGSNWDFSQTPGSDFSEKVPVALQPGEAMTAPTFLPSLEKWVVGVWYSTAPYVRLLPRWLRRYRRVESFVRTRIPVAWSNPITRSSQPTDIAAPLGAATNQITLKFPDDWVTDKGMRAHLIPTNESSQKEKVKYRR